MRAFEFLDKFDTLNSKTMVIDKGLGYKHVEDMLKVNGKYFDFIKYGWGTSILCDDNVVKAKNEIYDSDIVAVFSFCCLHIVNRWRHWCYEYYACIRN